MIELEFVDGCHMIESLTNYAVIPRSCLAAEAVPSEDADFINCGSDNPGVVASLSVGPEKDIRESDC